MVTFSFLLVNYNMSGLVATVVRNIADRLPAGSTYEILIADNSSDPAQALHPGSLPPDLPITLLPQTENRGFVEPLNRLLDLAQGGWIMIMHPDVEFQEGCLEALAGFLERHDQAAVVSPDLSYPDGAPNKIRLRFPSVGSEAKRVANMVIALVSRRRPLRDEVLWDRATDATTETVMSVCMLFRAEALRQAGPVDPRLVFYYANDYLCGRVRQLGWTCHHVRSAHAIHFERHTARALYSDSVSMDYKRDPVAASAGRRVDYFTFLSHFYPRGSRLVLRGFALLDDGIQLVAQLKRPRERWQNIRRLVQSIRIDLGGAPRA